MDQMVLKTQQWLNSTYRDKAGFKEVKENGQTGWPTIYALIRALQIELGITQTANNFGPGTQSRFKNRWPQGISKSGNEDNVHGIIQGALWCKGYAAVYGGITREFTDGMASSIVALKEDIGIGGTSSVIDLDLMMVLLSMKQFKLLKAYGGKEPIRAAQKQINRNYKAYTGIIPTDGLYGREMNTALIQVLQAIEGLKPGDANGYFGPTTKSKLKTVASGTSDWVWLATLALLCNGYNIKLTNTWNNTIADTIRTFQGDYALPVTGVVDPTTWMSLLTSKGDPNRACVACDTRFEITDELAAHLKADGYQIVGRYLSEPNQENKEVKDYFKAIRPGELERITAAGLKYFPIFQEYSTKLSHFSAATGARHAKEAREAAQKLGVPPTIIYFAVDYDATDPEVTSHILPYFKAIKENIGREYRVGIYGSRNICARVAQAGYAEASFVSDMSTGFSGNLGFAIPDNWVFDQFTEIHKYHGKWDLDRVAYSGKRSAVSTVNTNDTSPSYQDMGFIELVEALESRFNAIQSESPNLNLGVDIVSSDGGTVALPNPVWRCLLNYLSKSYLRGSTKWAISAEEFRDKDAKILEADPVASKIIAALDRWVGKKREEWHDAHGGIVDVAHMFVTTLGYLNQNGLVPNKWTGWAGDLASALPNIQVVYNDNPTADLKGIATALVGQNDDYKQHPGLKGLNLPEKLANNCNYSDLCSDGDAIAMADYFRRNPSSDSHHLSRRLRSYYNNPSQLANRFKNIASSIGAHNLEDAKKKLFAEIDGPIDDRYVGLLADGYDGAVGYSDVYITPEVKHAASDALAEFIF